MTEGHVDHLERGEACAPPSGQSDPCPDINTDHRNRFDWESRYPPKARIRIIFEMLWALLILIVPIFFILINWDGVFTNSICLIPESKVAIRVFSIYAFSGMLGGATYGAKYLYRVVGRGYWHSDRLVWRIVSPFVSLVLGLIAGTLVESAILNAPGGVSAGRCISIGFLSGYFADQAVGKMCDVAEAIFGKATVKS